MARIKEEDLRLRLVVEGGSAVRKAMADLKDNITYVENSLKSLTRQRNAAVKAEGEEAVSVCQSGICKEKSSLGSVPKFSCKLDKSLDSSDLSSNSRDDPTRTDDPYVPNVVRYQLRYIPIDARAALKRPSDRYL